MPVKPIEDKNRDVSLAGPRRLKLGAEGGEKQDRQARHPLDEQVEQLTRAGVDPVDILEEHQHGTLLRQGFELPDQRLEGFLLFSLGRELERREATCGRQRQQLGQQRHVLLGRRAQREQRRQLVQLRFGRVLALEPGCTLKLRDDRMKRAVLVVRRAEIAKAGVRLVPDPLLQGGGETGLADARLAREQHYATFTALRAIPLPLQYADLLLTAHERCERRPVQRLEPTFDSALANHLEGVHRLRKAFHLDGAEVAVLEEMAQQTLRLRPDHDRAGFGQSLQARGEVRRLAHDAALLAFAGGDQIADDHQPCVDSDTNLQRLGRLKRPDSAYQSKAGPHRPLGIVLVRLRVAEVHQHPIAHVLGDKPVEAGDRIGDTAMIGADDLAHVLWIHSRCQHGRADQIGEQHGELPAFGG